NGGVAAVVPLIQPVRPILVEVLRRKEVDRQRRDACRRALNHRRPSTAPPAWRPCTCRAPGPPRWLRCPAAILRAAALLRTRRRLCSCALREHTGRYGIEPGHPGQGAQEKAREHDHQPLCFHLGFTPAIRTGSLIIS